MTNWVVKVFSLSFQWSSGQSQSQSQFSVFGGQGKGKRKKGKGKSKSNGVIGGSSLVLLMGCRGILRIL